MGTCGQLCLFRSVDDVREASNPGTRPQSTQAKSTALYHNRRQLSIQSRPLSIESHESSEQEHWEETFLLQKAAPIPCRGQTTVDARTSIVKVVTGSVMCTSVQITLPSQMIPRRQVAVRLCDRRTGSPGASIHSRAGAVKGMPEEIG